MVAWIPERKLATSEMRRVLPDAVPRADAIANLARVAVGVAGLASGRTDLLRLLTEDRLHEPYRASVYPELPRLVAAARDAGALGAFLSGAGSTVAAFVDANGRIGRRPRRRRVPHDRSFARPSRAASRRSRSDLIGARLVYHAD